jgi:hypothetical protein
MNIMPPLFLNSLNPDQVVSARILEAFVGTPPRRLLIFTGIAMPALESKGQVDGQEVTIDLNARSNTRDPEYAATVGLASIYNSDSDLIFSTDNVKVITGRDLELLLVCNIAVMGDRSVLNRFAYQATVFLQADNGTIAGTIRWDPHFLIFAGPEHDLFQINALTMQAHPGGPDGFGTTNSKIERVGTTVGSVVRRGVMMGIDYVIHDLPLGVAITVGVNPKPGAFVIVNSETSFNFFQVSGPEPTTLSPVHLLEKPVDFEARPFFGPR